MGVFIGSARHNRFGDWTVQGIVNNIQVPEIPTEVEGALFHLRMFFLPHEVDNKIPIHLQWKNLKRKRFSIVEDYFPEIVRMRGGGGASVVTIEIAALPVLISGLHQMVVYHGEELRHVSTVDIYKDFVDLDP